MIIIYTTFAASLPINSKNPGSKAVIGIPEAIPAAVKKYEPNKSSKSPKNVAKPKPPTLLPQEAFDFTLTCYHVTQEWCDQAFVGLHAAGALIAESLLIRKQIVVVATVKPFRQPDHLATANVNVYHYARNKNGQLLAYPQSLVKQAILGTNNIDFIEPDITININSKGLFYFESRNIEINEHQYDFQQVMVHEITHGLGMHAALKFDKEVKPILTPPMQYREGYSYFAPPSVFVSLLTGEKDLLAKLAAQIATTEKKKVTPDFYLQQFAQDPSQLAMGKRLYAASRAQDLRFHPKGSEPLWMQNSERYDPDSSISHVKSEDQQAKDYVMFPNCMPGLNFKIMRKILRMSSVYGHTLNLLEKMGYATKSKPVFPSLTIEQSIMTPDNYSPSDARYIKNFAITEPLESG